MTNPTEKPRVLPPNEFRIGSEIVSDGTYGIVLAYGDKVRALDREEVYRYCQAVTAASMSVEHEAAIYRQLTGQVGLPVADVVQLLAEFRLHRPSSEIPDMEPLGLAPGLTFEGKPFLVVSIAGNRVGQWSPTEARVHALACMEIVEANARDNDYFAFMTQEMELGEGEARSAVAALSEFLDLFDGEKE